MSRIPGRTEPTDALRIALVGPYRFPVSEPYAGGLESHVSQLAARLRAEGHRVTLFARSGSDGVEPGDELGGSLPRWEPTDAARADVSMPPAAAMLEHHAYQRLMLRLIHGEARRRFDLVHLHTVHHLPVALAPSVPVPVLATLHTPPTPWLESTLAVTQGDGASFTAVSGHVSRAWTVLPHRPHVVLNGVDTDVWRPGPGGDALVWSGRLVPEKAPHLAILAARRAGRRIVLAGPLLDRDYVAREVTPLLGDDAAYAGHLGQRELANLVGRSGAALVTPVWEEPFGLTVAEAMACGTPVVAFDRGGVSEVIGAGGSGVLVPADDTEAMAAAIPVALRLDRVAVRHDAVTRLSHDRMVREYVGHYRRLLVAAPAAAPVGVGLRPHELQAETPPAPELRTWPRSRRRAFPSRRDVIGLTGLTEE